jgi:hypothetical protein
MKVSQTELFAVIAILLYVVFFSHSPPYILRSMLGNVWVAGGVFALLAYITLWQNRTIGVLLILAFLLTMTRVTEHLDAGAKPPSTPDKPPTPPTNTPPPPPPPASSTTTNTIDASSVPGMAASTPSTGTTMDPQGNIVDSTGKVVQAAGSGVTATATTTAAPAQTTSAPTAPPANPTAPATPPVATTPPAPVMSCNLESFASF